MFTRRTGFLTLLAAAGLVIATLGCGDDTEEGAGTRQPESATSVAATGSTLVTPTSTAASTAAVAPPEAEECPSDRKTLEVAIEAYYATNGTYPSDQAELVSAQMLRVEFETYDVEAGTGGVVRVVDVPCSSPAADEAPVTADELYAQFDEDTIESLGGPDCARELAELGAAFSNFEAREGRNPESMQELSPDLAIEPVLWVIDFDGERVDPAPGSPCPDISAFDDDSPSDQCDAARKTLEIARDAYDAMLGPEAPEPSEAELVAQGLIRMESDLYDLVDGEVVPVAGGPCN